MASVSDRRWAVREGVKVRTAYKGDNPWRLQWREHANGARKTEHFATKAAADRRRAEIEHKLALGTYIAPEVGRLTLRDWCELYLERQPWRESTRLTARASLTHALEVLGDKPLSSIRRGDVQAMLGGVDRAPGTVRLVRQHLRSALQAAVDDERIARNPAAGVKLEGKAGGEIMVPTVQQVQAIYLSAPEWFRVAIVLGAGLGLRQAEASGLTVDRIDWLRDRSVRVDRQWATKVKPFRFAPPKSAAGVRTIPAADVVLAELGRHVEGGEGFVLHRDGEPVSHNVFGFAWRQTVAEAGLSGMKFHALRHHFASSLISAGCSVKAVQVALGHSSATTTLDTYGHLWPGDDDRIRAAVQSSLAPTGDPVATGERAADA